MGGGREIAIGRDIGRVLRGEVSPAGTGCGGAQQCGTAHALFTPSFALGSLLNGAIPGAGRCSQMTQRGSGGCGGGQLTPGELRASSDYRGEAAPSTELLPAIDAVKQCSSTQRVHEASVAVS